MPRLDDRVTVLFTVDGKLVDVPRQEGRIRAIDGDDVMIAVPYAEPWSAKASDLKPSPSGGWTYIIAKPAHH